jgi:pimeloyl-ACP methyl ester carboxylesterase
MESAHVQAGDIRMHYLHAGTGSPIVLVHGFPQTSYEWRFVAPRLAEHHAVYAIDTRGHGGTDKPADGYTRADLAADIVHFLDALDLEQATIVGHDWGGIIACKLALDWPDRVSRLALVDTICTGWPSFVDYYYWFMAAPLPERFLATYHRQWIETLFTGTSDPPIPAAPESSRHAAERAVPVPWATRQDVDVYAAAVADPAVHAADIAYYRSLPFHRVIADAAAPGGERYERVTQEEMARLWLENRAGKQYLDYAPEDRHKQYPGPALWLYSEAFLRRAKCTIENGVPVGEPAFEIFPRLFPRLEMEGVAAGHFLPEEVPELVADRILRFVS